MPLTSWDRESRCRVLFVMVKAIGRYRPHFCQIQLRRRAPGAAASCTKHKLCAVRVSTISTLHVDPDQPNPRPDPSRTPSLWELEVGRGSHAAPPRVSVAFKKKKVRRPTDTPYREDPHPAQNFVQDAAAHSSKQMRRELHYIPGT